LGVVRPPTTIQVIQHFLILFFEGFNG